jgi:hypothetical protein
MTVVWESQRPVSTPMDVMSHAPKRSALSLFTFVVLAWSAGCHPALTDGPIQKFSCEIPGEGTGGSGEGAVEVRDDEVQSVDVQTSFPGLPGRWGYSCTFRANRSDHESTWTVEGGETTVDLIWPGGDRARIVPLPGGYRIDLRNAKLSTCGAGAELPEEITILEAGGQCRVVWNDIGQPEPD